MTAFFLAVLFVLLRSRLGASLQAIRDDEEAAASVGVRVTAGKRILFVLAAAGCGGAGALILANTLFIEPDLDLRRQLDCLHGLYGARRRARNVRGTDHRGDRPVRDPEPLQRRRRGVPDRARPRRRCCSRCSCRAASGGRCATASGCSCCRSAGSCAAPRLRCRRPSRSRREDHRSGDRARRARRSRSTTLELGELRPAEILVEVAAAGICHTDLICRDQWYSGAASGRARSRGRRHRRGRGLRRHQGRVRAIESG